MVGVWRREVVGESVSAARLVGRRALAVATRVETLDEVHGGDEIALLGISVDHALHLLLSLRGKLLRLLTHLLEGLLSLLHDIVL